jgi:hypothetical protein
MKYAIIVLALLLSGCVTQQRCHRKFPPQTHTNTVTITEIVYRDTVVYVTIKPDTIFFTDTVLVKEGLVNFNPQRLDTEFAWSVVWINNSRLNHTLYQKESVIEQTIANAIKEQSTTTEVTVVQTVEVNKLTWWQTLWVTLGQILSVSLLIVVLFFIGRMFMRF